MFSTLFFFPGIVKQDVAVPQMFNFIGHELRDIEIMRRMDDVDGDIALLTQERDSRRRMRVYGRITLASQRLRFVLQAYDRLSEIGYKKCLEMAVVLADEAIERNVDVILSMASKDLESQVSVTATTCHITSSGGESGYCVVS